MESKSEHTPGVLGNAACVASPAGNPWWRGDRTRWKPILPYGRWERTGQALFVVLLLVGFPIALNRAICDSGGTDFTQFCRSGRYVLKHRDTEPHRFLKVAIHGAAEGDHREQ